MGIVFDAMDLFGVSSLENNFIVSQLPEIAKESANIGKTLEWENFFNNDQY